VIRLHADIVSEMTEVTLSSCV